MSWFKWFVVSVVAGVIWGMAAMLTNSLTGAFMFEDGLLHNLVSFTTGGVILCMLTGGLLNLMGKRLPFKRPLPKAVLISGVVWITLRLGGAFLSSMDSERYHFVTAQSVQGFALAMALGVIIGFLWDKDALSFGNKTAQP